MPLEDKRDESGGRAFELDADPTAYNVESIARLEKEALLERSAAERFSDAITKAIGSIGFLIFHVALFVVWAAVNLGLVPGIPLFDPFPFGILTLIVSAGGVFLAIFILISQNRVVRQADRRVHLSLQVSRLAEQELTTLLRMQQRLCSHLGVEVESIQKQAEQLVKETNVEELVDYLDEKLPKRIPVCGVSKARWPVFSEPEWLANSAATLSITSHLSPAFSDGTASSSGTTGYRPYF